MPKALKEVCIVQPSVVLVYIIVHNFYSPSSNRQESGFHSPDTDPRKRLRQDLDEHEVEED
jgi:FtsZ-interacting cell division protein ZipA